jgi:hypothetical protein
LLFAYEINRLRRFLALCAKSAMISTGSWPAPSALSGCKNSRENAALFQKPAITREVRHLQIPAKPCPGSVSGAHWRGTQTHRKGHPQWHNVAAKAENSPSRRFPSSPGTRPPRPRRKASRRASGASGAPSPKPCGRTGITLPLARCSSPMCAKPKPVTLWQDGFERAQSDPANIR